jgi:hypothetical protein
MDAQEAPLMKKKAIQLVALAAMLAVALAAYFAATSANRRGAEEAAKKEAESLLYKNGRGDPVVISFGAGGETPLEFALDGGVWRYAEIPDFPLAQSYVTRVAASLNTLKPDRVMKPELPLGEYGLDEPSYILNASDGVSEPFTLLFGANIGEFVYAMQPDGGVIYTVRASLASFLGVGLYDMAALETPPAAEPERMTALTLTRGGYVFSAERRGVRGESVWIVTGRGLDVKIDDVLAPSGGERSAKRYLDAALDALSAPAFSACVDWRATDAALAAYGLAGAPPTGGALTVELAFMSGSGFITEEKSLTLHIGDPAADGSGRYARLGGSEFVNILPSSYARPLVELFDALAVTSTPTED